MQALLRSALCLLGILASHQATAFCVYNKTDRGNATFDQYNWHENNWPKKWKDSFAAFVRHQGKEACCNWRNSSCNPEGGQQKSMVSFKISVKQTGLGSFSCEAEHKVIQIQAGGWIEVHDNKSFDKSKKPSAANPPFNVETFEVDGRQHHAAHCPHA